MLSKGSLYSHALFRDQPPPLSVAAARALWAEHAPRLLAYARSLVRDHSLADDVVQEALCRALRQDSRTLRGVDDVRAWLASIVRREAINQLRTLSRERWRALAHADRTVRTSPREALFSNDVQRAIDRLARRNREILILRHVCGLTFDQLAPATGLSRSAAASIYTAAMSRLRELLPHPDNDEQLRAPSSSNIVSSATPTLTQSPIQSLTQSLTASPIAASLTSAGVPHA